jgi:hypothetical protein
VIDEAALLLLHVDVLFSRDADGRLLAGTSPTANVRRGSSWRVGARPFRSHFVTTSRPPLSAD